MIHPGVRWKSGLADGRLTSAIVKWLVRHAARLHNRYHVGQGGRTPQARVARKRSGAAVAEFCEREDHVSDQRPQQGEASVFRLIVGARPACTGSARRDTRRGRHLHGVCRTRDEKDRMSTSASVQKEARRMFPCQASPVDCGVSSHEEERYRATRAHPRVQGARRIEDAEAPTRQHRGVLRAHHESARESPRHEAASGARGGVSRRHKGKVSRAAGQGT